jgi:hypothetical protein
MVKGALRWVTMTLRRALPLVVLGGTLAVLAVPVIIGDGGARLGALCAVAGILVASMAVARGARVEHPELRALDALAAGAAGTGAVGLGTAVTMSAIVLWTVAPGSGPREAAGWPGPALATIAAIALVASLAWGARSVMRREGIERDALLKATSLAFFVTVLLSGGYALFEVMADAPTISMWVPWSVGMLTWAGAAAVLGKRMA